MSLQKVTTQTKVYITKLKRSKYCLGATLPFQSHTLSMLVMQPLMSCMPCRRHLWCYELCAIPSISVFLRPVSHDPNKFNFLLECSSLAKSNKVPISLHLCYYLSCYCFQYSGASRVVCFLRYKE